MQIAGLFGGGLHSASGDGWTVDVITAEWPNERVILSSDGSASAELGADDRDAR